MIHGSDLVMTRNNLCMYVLFEFPKVGLKNPDFFSFSLVWVCNPERLVGPDLLL